ncbi:MAG: hypothetical protein GC171_09460 [Terrimonas sp.]|nr:hypothetical protein [Terrimonas sp.]
MDYDSFKESLAADHPPPGISPYLAALWQDANGDWETAHHIIQDIDDSIAAEIHAYLHRKEGDLGNADYWYRKAGQKRPGVSLPEEWERIAKKLT